MPRPRTITDDAILDAVLTAMERTGPDGLTFAAAGKAVGLSPATLVQRYATRAGLVQAALLHAWDRLDARTEKADTEFPVTPQGAVEMLVSLSFAGANSSDYDQGLLLLREDMRDLALRARGASWGRALARVLGRRLTADPAREEILGRLMASQWQGALIWWGFSRNGDPAETIAEQLRVWCALVLAR